MKKPEDQDSADSVVLAEVTRGKLVESRHRGVIVIADAAGNVIWSTSEKTRFPVVFPRSCSKPFQAISVFETGTADAFDLSTKQQALLCASHGAEKGHMVELKKMLAKTGLDEKCLHCGLGLPQLPRDAAKFISRGSSGTKLHHNCSGKHIGMLMTCLCSQWPIETYSDPRHPLQKLVLQNLSQFCGVAANEIYMSKDGCNLPAHAVPLDAMATAYARLVSPDYWTKLGRPERAESVKRISSAMSKHPFLVGGTDRSETDLMLTAGNAVVAKIGAEAVWCAGFPQHGVGMAIKIEDGANRSQSAIIAEALRQTKLLKTNFVRDFMLRQDQPVKTTDGTCIGEFRPAFQLIDHRKRS